MSLLNIINKLKPIILVNILCLFSLDSALADSLDDIRNRLKEDVKHEQYSAAYGILMAFETEPDIDSSTYYIEDADDTVLDVYKIPLQTQLYSAGGMDVYGRIGFNYATMKANDIMDKGISGNSIRAKWTTYSTTLGVVSEIKIIEHYSLIMALDSGIGRLENTAQYKGTFSKALKPAIDGILFDWSTNTALISGVLGAKYNTYLSENELEIRAHISHSYVTTFSETKDFSGFSANTNTFSLASDFTHSWHTRLMSYPLSGIAHVGYTSFLGSDRDVLGFKQFVELGYSMKLDISQKTKILQSLNMGAKLIVGDNNMDGWGLIIGYRF